MNKLEFKVKVKDGDRWSYKFYPEEDCHKEVTTVGDSEVRVFVDGIDILSEDKDDRHIGMDMNDLCDVDWYSGWLKIGICGCGCDGCDDVVMEVTSDESTVRWDDHARDRHYCFDKEVYAAAFCKLKEEWERKLKGMMRRREAKVTGIMTDILKGTTFDDGYKFQKVTASVLEQYIRYFYVNEKGLSRHFSQYWDGHKIYERAIKRRALAFVRTFIENNESLLRWSLDILIDFMYAPMLVCKYRNVLYDILSTAMHCEKPGDRLLAILYNRSLPVAEDEGFIEKLKNEFYPEGIIRALKDLREYAVRFNGMGLKAKMKTMKKTEALRVLYYGEIYPEKKDEINAAIDKFLDSFDCKKRPSEEIVTAMENALMAERKEDAIAALIGRKEMNIAIYDLLEKYEYQKLGADVRGMLTVYAKDEDGDVDERLFKKYKALEEWYMDGQPTGIEGDEDYIRLYTENYGFPPERLDWEPDSSSAFISPLHENAFSEPILHRVVLSKIDFELPDNIWKAINDEFEFYWNNVAGVGNVASCDEACNWICYNLEQEMVPITLDKVVTIVNIIWDFIEQIPGVLLDDEEDIIETSGDEESTAKDLLKPMDTL